MISQLHRPPLPTTSASFEGVLDFWFSHRGSWWSPTPAFDGEIRRRFDGLRREVLRGDHEDWRRTPRGALAYVIVLDQLSRNLFRRDARAYEADAQALDAAHHALARHHDAALSMDERVFLYMPFLHSEEMADQERSLSLFRHLGHGGSLRAAEQHHEVIRRFGRFPHRNETLGRFTTPEEEAFLRQPGSSFA